MDTPSKLFPPSGDDWNPRQFSLSANRFGAGELDGYEFNEEFSHLSNEASGMEGDKENRGPEGDSMMPSQPPIFDWSLNSSPPSEAPELQVSRRRQKSTSRRSGRASFPYSDIFSTGNRRDTAGSEVKRPRTSPSKDPTPKRRRTLHKSDVSYGMDDGLLTDESVQLSHKQVQAAFEQLRQESRNGDWDEMAEAEGASTRPSLRPRTPTPSQRSSIQRDRQPLAEIEKSPARSSRHSHASTALPVGSKPETSRKPSIKTEDFINEANKIMAMIRSKAGLASGLASLEESDEEKGQQSPDLEDSYQESTQEPFSRPPSREGRPPLTRMSTKQEDPTLAERLKKYEEASDMGDIITSSMRSAALQQEDFAAAAREQERGSRRSEDSFATNPWPSDDGAISDPPNIRISRDPEWYDRQSANEQNDGVPSHGSSGPPTQRTGMSIQTTSSQGSSRGSEARKTIAPESVSHLIPDQVGNMILDRQRNIWVRRKPSTVPEEAKPSFLPSEASEDDPFAGIPDLSVDITNEMRNLRLTAKKELPPKDGLPSGAPDWEDSPTRKSQTSNRSAAFNTVEEAVEYEICINGNRVKEPRRLTISFSSPVASVIQNPPVAESDVTSEDASILDQATDGFPFDRSPRSRRSVSIHHHGTARSTGSLHNSRGPARHLSVRGQSLMARPVSRIDEHDEESVVEQAQQQQEAASGMELSVLGDRSVVSHDADAAPPASLSFVATTPPRNRDCPIAGLDATPIISQFVGNFSLSPLSDFTLRHHEESLPLEASYIVDNHRLVTGDPSKRVMSMSMRELVDKIAEVEPFEPYWDDMRDLMLRDKGLSALHALDEFCGHLESLDVSKNQIRNLDGIPATVRHLRMMDNQLSSLTAWNHLVNLQYIDISNNGVTSLAAFASLVHLRSLRVDNNQITSLDGIKFHKGLQILRARGNLIETVDFDGATMHELADLDLKNNRISRVAHIGQLQALHSLNLENNRLESFAVDPLPHHLDSKSSCSQLRYLHLDDNRLASLSLHRLPHLRLLHADRNRLVRLSGLSSSRCGRRIDSLSLREQQGGEEAGREGLDVAHLLERVYEVRKLFLSGNYLGGCASTDNGRQKRGFVPPVDLLNLQLLELANCGLSDDDLPQKLGLMMPNLRVINVNMNALTENGIGEMLRAVPRLKRVLMAGNRVRDLGRVVDILRASGGCLTAVDMRDCPVTGGFYAPVSMQLQRLEQTVAKRSQDGADDDYGVETGSGKLDPFALPDQDVDRDRAFCGRLDMDTRVKRKLYEALVARGCGRLRRLDGLPVKGRGKKMDGDEGRDGKGEDAVMAVMRERGLIKGVEVKGGEKGESEKGGNEKLADRNARWPAEDSFA